MKFVGVTFLMSLFLVALFYQPAQGFECACPRHYMPVCGSDHKTYSNLCVFECQKQRFSDLQIIKYGECENAVDPNQEAQEHQNEILDGEDNCPCILLLAPVCGSDGITYDNLCNLECRQKKLKSLTVIKDGPC